MRGFVLAVVSLLLALPVFVAIASLSRLALSGAEAVIAIGLIALALYAVLDRLSRRG